MANMLDGECTNQISYALRYLDKGLSIFPLIPKGKKPVPGFKWEPFQHMMPTQEQVKAWFDGSDNSNNIAVVTGATSRLLAFDIDGLLAKSHADEVIRNKICQVTRDALAETLWVETGGDGLHVWIRYKPDEFTKDDTAAREIKNAVLWRGKDGHSEVRLKSDGGYIVAPPSVHPNGNAYRLFKGTSIAELSKEQILDLIQSFRSIGGNCDTTTQKEAAKNRMLLTGYKDFHCRPPFWMKSGLWI
jgi:hypothetical protein